MTPAQYHAIDPWVTWRAAAGDLDVFRTLAWIYLEQAPALVQRLHQALAQDARAEVCMASHTLNGMAAMLGASELCGLLRQLEQAARNDLPAPPEVAGVGQLCLRVQAEVAHCATRFDGGRVDGDA